MAGEEIRYTITPDGIKVEASGFTGGKCITELKEFEKFMRTRGVECTEESTKMKSEGYGNENVLTNTSKQH